MKISHAATDGHDWQQIAVYSRLRERNLGERVDDLYSPVMKKNGQSGVPNLSY